MPVGYWINDEFEVPTSGPGSWTHITASQLSQKKHLSTYACAWSTVVPSLPDSHTLNEYKRIRNNRGGRPSDRGTSGFCSSVWTTSVIPPRGTHTWAEPIPVQQEKEPSCRCSNNWLSEHLKLTSKHIPSRVPLPDKGKPAERQGRKATDQVSDLTAGLPEEE